MQGVGGCDPYPLVARDTEMRSELNGLLLEILRTPAIVSRAVRGMAKV